MITILRHQFIKKRSARVAGPRRSERSGLLLHRQEYVPARRPLLLGGQKPSRGKFFHRFFNRKPKPLAAQRIERRKQVLTARAGKTRHQFPPSRVSERRDSRGRQACGARRESRGGFWTRLSNLVKGANPILTAALAVLILTSLLVPAIAMRSAPLSRPSLPVSTDADTALYGIVIPEEEQPTPASRTDLSRLNSLAMASYTIRRGETISEIARKLKLNLDTLISFNGIQDVRSLSVGTSLEYPNSDGLKYTVRRGDTLNKIAKSFSAPMEGILDWNGLTTSVITVGQQLFIPGARMNPNDINRILGMLFLFPVRGDISSRFGNRPDPFTGIVRFHNGVDITNKLDTPITAAMAGKVGAVGFNPNYGRFVIINHPGTGYQTLYGHLDKILVSKGENVKQGEPIGKLGDTGYSTGPHLHFSIFKNNEPVDPLRYLK